MKEIGNIHGPKYSKAISVAADLFLEKGIDDVKMTDIAERSNVGVASLYRCFTSKTKIVIQAGRIVWDRINEDFTLYLEGDASKSGLEQMIYCLKFYRQMYEHYRPFLKFLDDFDRLMLAEKVPAEDLVEYEKSIINLYEPLSEAYQRGVKDGTLKDGIDFNLFYLSMTHALISSGQKFIRGAILPHDNFSCAEQEIDQLIDMAVQYMRK